MNYERPDLPNEYGEINYQELSPIVICRSAIGSGIWAGDACQGGKEKVHTLDSLSRIYPGNTGILFFKMLL